MRNYDESALLARLEPLDRWEKSAFAAAGAQRLFPLFERYAQSVGVPAQARKLAASMAPTDFEGEWVFESGYGQNVAAAVAYAVRTWIKNDPQEAAWAARQVYDAAEYAVLQPVDDKELTVYKPDVSATTAKVLQIEIVRTALSALERDLETVESSPASCLELRKRAEHEGSSWAASFP